MMKSQNRLQCYYNRQCKQITLSEFCDLFENNEYRNVAKDKFGKFCVSTIWLGIDHQFCEGPPVIFETLVFDDSGDVLYKERHSTEEEAKHRHVMVCRSYNIEES